MKLIGIDLDGTLLNSRQNISQKNTQILQSLPKDCFPFICSGREVDDINNILKQSGLTIPAVGLNGSIGYDGDKKLFEFFFNKDDIKDISLLNDNLKKIVGVLDTSLFYNIATKAIVASEDKVRLIEVER